MNDHILDTLLRLQQIERHHQQRLDTLWTQFKDAWTVVQALEIGLLSFAVGFPGLPIWSRELLAFVIVTVPLTVLLFSRARLERDAPGIVADYKAEYRLVTGIEPPRPLYSRALRLGNKREASRPGAVLVPASDGSEGREPSAL